MLQVYDIVERWKDVKVNKEQIPTDSQLILLGSLWTPAIGAFVTHYMSDCVVCIGSKHEAAVYGGIKIVNMLWLNYIAGLEYDSDSDSCPVQKYRIGIRI